jgi:cell division protease FtsH
VNLTKDRAENMISFLMGGRVAEELVLHQKTTGAGNDIERASDLARRMVCEWGMSDVLGPLTFGQKEGQIFLGRDISQNRDYSEQTAQVIDREVRDIVERNYRRAVEILSDKMQALHDLSAALLEFETLDGEEIDQVIRGEKIVRKPAETSSQPPTPSAEASKVDGELRSTKPTGEGGSTPAPLPA